MTDIEFVKFPKLYRLNGDTIVTEKIDGTNACIVIDELGNIYAQSRTRIITPQSDNFGFAGWVDKNKEYLVSKLGIGRHYGEWWGKGIQRGYGRVNKIFSLFNTSVWSEEMFANRKEQDISVVPVLFTGAFITAVTCAELFMDNLKASGSIAAPQYDNPEGIVIYDINSGYSYKKTFDYDDTGKGGRKDIDGNVI
jgi:hypothetical protein